VIALSESNLVLRLAAPMAWRSERKIAAKLMGFSATEHGSALDMMRAAELSCGEHRRLFYRHALDEHRHARRFAELARRISPQASVRSYERHHAEPQDLYRRLGPTRFLAFVHLSEAQAERQFASLARHFAGNKNPHAPILHTLFSELAREEHVHVAYSRHLLEKSFPEATRDADTRRALRRQRRTLAWAAWKRAGFRIGDRLIALLMLILFIAVIPPFALIARLTRRPSIGWIAASDHDARRAA
jgi:rubrerythrin